MQQYITTHWFTREDAKNDMFPFLNCAVTCTRNLHLYLYVDLYHQLEHKLYVFSTVNYQIENVPSFAEKQKEETYQGTTLSNNNGSTVRQRRKQRDTKIL